MAVVPTGGQTPPLPEPDPSQTVVDPFAGPAPAAPTPEEIERLRGAATAIGLNYDTMSEQDHDFLRMFSSGALDSLPAGADPENPLIPGEPDPSAAAPTAPDAATPPTGEPGVGPGEPGEGSVEVPPTGGAPTPTSPAAGAAPVPTTPPEGTTPDAAVVVPGFQIPSPLPPPLEVPAPAAPPEPAEPMVYLPNGNLVPLSVARMLATPQQTQPGPGFVGGAPGNPTFPAPAAPAQPPVNPTPSPWDEILAQTQPPAPAAGLDPATAARVQALETQLAQQRQWQEQELARQRQANQQSLQLALNEATEGYRQARGLSPEQVQSLTDTATRLQAFGSYASLYPGDPRRAVGAALEMAYNITPEFRQLEVDREIERRRVADADVNAKKALAGQTAGSGGSVPRVPTAPAGGRMDRSAADAAIAAMVEADPAYQNRPRQ